MTHYTLHITHYTLHITHYTLNITHYTLHITHPEYSWHRGIRAAPPNRTFCHCCNNISTCPHVQILHSIDFRYHSKIQMLFYVNLYNPQQFVFGSWYCLILSKSHECISSTLSYKPLMSTLFGEHLKTYRI